jgi:hypothetical protein
LSRIFISYRREDSAGYAGRLYDRLSQHFGSDQIFMDIDTIKPGVDFVEVIEEAVGSCDVLIALIGKQWLTITDARGQQRLNDPTDFVRLEIKAALDRNIRVIPALIRGAAMPRSQALPEGLKSLARRNAIEISDTRFHQDVDRLISELEEVLGLPSPARHRRSRPVTEPGPRGFERWWRVGVTLLGGILATVGFAIGWEAGILEPAFLLFLIPVPFVVVGIEHLVKGRWLRSLVFLASLGLLVSEVSPFQPYRLFPPELRSAINVATSILIPTAIVWSIIDAVRNKIR